MPWSLPLTFGFAVVQNQIDDVPLYVNAKELVAADGSVEALELNYIMCFAHNGPHTIGGCFPVSYFRVEVVRRLWLLRTVNSVHFKGRHDPEMQIRYLVFSGEWAPVGSMAHAETLPEGV